MQAAENSRPKTMMTMQEVPDGKGGTVHKLMPARPEKAGKKKKATLPDPIVNNVAASDENLLQFIQRIERLNEEKDGIAADIRDVYLESKSQGYDPKIIRQIVAQRKLPAHDLAEMEAIKAIYKDAIGMEF